MNDAPPTTPIRLLVWALRPHWGWVAALSLLSAAQVAGTIVLPLLIGRAIQQITLGLTSDLDVTAVLIGLLGIVLAGFYAAQEVLAGNLSLRVERELRDRLYAHLHAIEPRVAHQQPTGQLVTLVTADLIPISSFLGTQLSRLVWAGLVLILAAAVMFVIQPLLAVLALVPAPLAVFAIVRFRRAAGPMVARQRQRMAEVTGLIQATIMGVAAIRGDAREQYELDRFRSANREVLGEALATNRTVALYMPSLVILPNLGSAIVVVVGGLLAIQGGLSVVDFSVFYTYLVMLVPAIQILGRVLGQAQLAVTCAERVAAGLADPVQTSVRETPLEPGPAGVELEGVHVASPDGRTVIENVDLHVPPGGTVAVVGKTGSGKTVMLRLVNRLTDAHEGSVRIGGEPVEHIDLAGLRGAVASAGSDEFLFAGTIAENISFGRPEASMDEIELAAVRAQAHGFISELPDGYETMIGDRGAGLSGGQRQRVALARALLSQPSVLLLDNVTGALDSLTEAAAVEELHRPDAEDLPTRIMVGYRPVLLSRADQVVVLEGGKVIARGTHAELLETSQKYRELVGAE